MTDTMMAPPKMIRVKPADAKFHKGTYEWEVVNASYYDNSAKNPDKVWMALKVEVKVKSGKMLGWPSMIFLQLPDEEDEQWYRSNLNALVRFASACAGAPLEEDFDMEFDEETGQCPMFIGESFWAYNDTDDKEDGRQFIKWDMTKLYFSNPETDSDSTPY